MASQLASILSRPWVTRACYKIQENQTWKALGVEVLGINLPKTATVRTKDEALDVGFNELGNTVGFFGGVWGGSKLLDRIMSSTNIRVNPNPAILSRGRVMKSFALIGPLVAFMLAIPFFRNAFTVWRAGAVDYKNLITNSQSRGEDPLNREKNNQAINDYVTKGLTILLAGFALGIGGFLWARSRGPLKMFRVIFPPHPNPLPHWGRGSISSKLIPALNKDWIRKALKAICLTGKDAAEIGKWGGVFYWGIPAYLGWMAASRDKFEIKEQLLKMLVFITVFVWTDKVVDLFFKSKAAKMAAKFPEAYLKTAKGSEFSYKRVLELLKLPKYKLILPFENSRLLAGLGMTILLMGAISTIQALLNIRLTRERMEKSGEIKHGALPQTTVTSARAEQLSNSAERRRKTSYLQPPIFPYNQGFFGFPPSYFPPVMENSIPFNYHLNYYYPGYCNRQSYYQ